MRMTSLDNFTRVEPEPGASMVSTAEAVRQLWVAEASDLELPGWPDHRGGEDFIYPGGQQHAEQRLGMIVTGRHHEVNFMVVQLFFSGEGEDRELGGWILEPTPESLREVQGCRGIQLQVFND